MSLEILTDWLGHGGRPVDRQTAQQRADVCIGCVHNQPRIAVTNAVAAAIKKALELKSSMQLRVDGEKSLHTCEVCGCVNKLQVWCPDSYIQASHSPNETYPDYCWKKAS